MNEKVETQETQLDTIDQVTLTPLVRSALGSETVEVVDWEREQLHGGIAVGSAVYRFSGRGRDQGQTMPWSLILKLLRPEGGSAEPSAWNYYKREADAYQSSMVDSLTDGLVTPRCFDIIEHPDGICWMWLEELTEEIGPQWPLEHYGIVARHLGHFNGIYLTSQPLPDWPWLSSSWLRQYVELSAPAMEALPDVVESRWGRRWLPEKDRDRYFHLWAERERYLTALDRLPQTLCHFDIFPRNLFARKTANGNDQTVAIDWAFVGRGPIGADLNPLVWISVGLSGVGLDKAQELEEIVFDGYLEGLHEAGWKVDPQQVRLGYTAASLRFQFGEVWRWLAWITDENLRAEAEQAWGMPMGQVFDLIAVMRPSFLGLLDEAQELINILL
jgi:hypothetical protein